MIKLMLNLHKFNNYAFFCPVSRLHLTVSSPVGFSNEVTPAILKALKAETVLDVDGVVDIETGTVKAGTQAPKQEKPVEKAPETKQEAPAKAEEPKVEAPKVEEPKAEEAKAEEASAEEKPKKGGKKAAKTADAE
jgi:hypothetical protein